MKRMQMATKNFNLAKLARNINIEDDGSIAFTSEVSAGGETIGSLTASMDSNQTTNITLSKASTPVPILQAYKEVPQIGISSKGNWDVNSNGTNYDFYDEKPISYSSANLTPSATGDGTFTNSAANTTYYDVANATYDSVSNAQYSGFLTAYSTIFNNNGTKAYVTAHNSSGDIYQYSLSTAYDVSTNTYDSKTYSFSQFTYPTASRFNGDGTKLYTVAWNGSASSSRIWQYSLSTAYDISTASYDSVNLNLTAHNFAWGFTFNNDGSKVFVSIVDGGATGGRIAEYSLSTNYDLSTAGSQTLYVLSGTGWANYGIEFNNDGTKLFVNNNDDVPTKGPHIFTLSTAYDISTVSYTNTSADVTTLFGGTTGAADITFNNNGSKMYISDSFNGYVRQFSVSTSTAFNEADVGKKVVGNSGSAIITATSGTYQSVTAFADTSTISSWQLFGAQGKADGSGIQLSGYSVASDIVFPTGSSGAGASMVYNNNVSPTSSAFNGLRNVVFNPTGTIALVMTSGNIQRWNLSTAFDLSTMTEAAGDNFGGQLNTTQYGLAVSSDGTKLFVGDHGTDAIKQFTLSTPWSPSTESYNGYYYLNSGGNWNSFSGADGVPSTTNFNPFSFQFNSDGTKMITIMWDNNPYHSVVEFALSTGWDMSTMSYTSFANFDGNIDPEAIVISADGLKIMMHGSNLGNAGTEVYALGSAFSVGNSGNSLTKTSGTIDLSSLTGNTNSINYGGLQMSHDGKRMWAIYAGDNKFYEITGGTTSVHPYSTYSPALTNSSSGQINSSSWLDINSMAADETKNAGDIFYAVSTDNRTSWGVAKASDGVRKIAKNNSGTWQYNNNGGTSVPSLTGTTYANKSKDVSAEGTSALDLFIKPDGTKLYVCQSASSGVRGIFQYTLSTAYDISTASYDNKTFSLVSAMSTNSNNPLSSLTINSNGSKFYCGSYSTNGGIMEFTMSTPWDISTGSYNNVLKSPADAYGTEIISIGKNDTRFYVGSRQDDKLREYALSTPGDLSTLDVTSNAYLAEIRFDQAPSSEGSTTGVTFNNTGTKLYFAGYNTDAIHQYSLSTPWDLSTINKDGISVSISSQTTVPEAFFYSHNGATFYAIGANDVIYQYTAGTESEYGTSETWVNGTNNNEHATLQQALTSQAFNRMNKAQLDSVADGYHFSQDSADTLDLMIALYADSGTSPISDGVTINYDAASKYRQAVPETDYRANFAGTSTVEFTSIISANFKVKVV